MIKKKRKPEEPETPASSGDAASEMNGTEPKKPHLDKNAAPSAAV